MRILKKYKNIIIVAVIIVIVAFSYNLFAGKTDKNLLTSEVKEAKNSVLETDLLSILIDLRLIKLDDSIFSDKAFQSLRDFGQDIVPEPVGRKNPFAPVDTNALTGSVIETE
jgi:hypothetical protein